MAIYKNEEISRNDVPVSGRRYIFCFDQNPPEIADVKTNIALFEQQPFDGMVMNVNGTDPVLGSTTQIGGRIWTANAFTWPGFSTTLSNLLTTNFIKFQHNFALATLQTSRTLGEPPLDWFDPAIETVVHNFRMLARLCHDGKLRGIFFDLEPDNSFSTAGWRLFKFSDRPNAVDQSVTRNLAAYKAQVRYIGKRICEVMQEEYPDMHLILTFGYEQLLGQDSTYEGDRNYGLLGAFLDGLFDVLKPPFEIHNWYEGGYGHYTESQMAYAVDQMDSPKRFSTARYNMVRGNASRADNLTATQLSSAIELGATLQSERYISTYQESQKFLVDPVTMDAAKITAIRNSRITLGMDHSFTPASYASLFLDLNPLVFVGFSNDDPIGSVTSTTGNAYTNAGGSVRPLYKSAGFGAGIPSMFFTAASSQILICDAVAALLATTPSQDFPYTFVWAQKLTAVGGGTFCALSFGRDATTNSQIRAQVTTTPNYQLQRLDDAGSADPESGGTANTNAHIVTMMSNGISASIRVDGAQIITNQAQDVGVMTLNQHAVGASRGNTTTAYFGGHIGRVLAYNKALGVEQLKILERYMGAAHGVTVV